jgi:hypothetical protein
VRRRRVGSVRQRICLQGNRIGRSTVSGRVSARALGRALAGGGWGFSVGHLPFRRGARSPSGKRRPPGPERRAAAAAARHPDAHQQAEPRTHRCDPDAPRNSDPCLTWRDASEPENLMAGARAGGGAASERRPKNFEPRRCDRGVEVQGPRGVMVIIVVMARQTTVTVTDDLERLRQREGGHLRLGWRLVDDRPERQEPGQLGEGVEAIPGQGDETGRTRRGLGRPSPHRLLGRLATRWYAQ